MIELSRTQTHVAVAAGFALVVASVVAVSRGVSSAAIYLVMSLFCIVAIAFADALGETIGWGGGKGPRVDRASPEWAVRLMGWLLLAMLSALTLFTAFADNR